MPKQQAMLIASVRSCAAACKQLHGFNTNPQPALSDTAFTVVEPRGDKFVHKVCKHCNHPAYASACPFGQ